MQRNIMILICFLIIRQTIQEECICEHIKTRGGVIGNEDSGRNSFDGSKAMTDVYATWLFEAYHFFVRSSIIELARYFDGVDLTFWGCQLCFDDLNVCKGLKNGGKECPNELKGESVSEKIHNSRSKPRDVLRNKALYKKFEDIKELRKDYYQKDFKPSDMKSASLPGIITKGFKFISGMPDVKYADGPTREKAMGSIIDLYVNKVDKAYKPYISPENAEPLLISYIYVIVDYIKNLDKLKSSRKDFIKFSHFYSTNFDNLPNKIMYNLNMKFPHEEDTHGDNEFRVHLCIKASSKDDINFKRMYKNPDQLAKNKYVEANDNVLSQSGFNIELRQICSAATIQLNSFMGQYCGLGQFTINTHGFEAKKFVKCIESIGYQNKVRYKREKAAICLDELKQTHPNVRLCELYFMLGNQMQCWRGQINPFGREDSIYTFSCEDMSQITNSLIPNLHNFVKQAKFNDNKKDKFGNLDKFSENILKYHQAHQESLASGDFSFKCTESNKLKGSNHSKGVLTVLGIDVLFIDFYLMQDNEEITSKDDVLFCFEIEGTWNNNFENYSDCFTNPLKGMDDEGIDWEFLSQGGGGEGGDPNDELAYLEENFSGGDSNMQKYQCFAYWEILAVFLQFNYGIYQSYLLQIKIPDYHPYFLNSFKVENDNSKSVIEFIPNTIRQDKTQIEFLFYRSDLKLILFLGKIQKKGVFNDRIRIKQGFIEFEVSISNIVYYLPYTIDQEKVEMIQSQDQEFVKNVKTEFLYENIGSSIYKFLYVENYMFEMIDDELIDSVTESMSSKLLHYSRYNYMSFPLAVVLFEANLFRRNFYKINLKNPEEPLTWDYMLKEKTNQYFNKNPEFLSQLENDLKNNSLKIEKYKEIAQNYDIIPTGNLNNEPSNEQDKLKMIIEILNKRIEDFESDFQKSLLGNQKELVLFGSDIYRRSLLFEMIGYDFENIAMIKIQVMNAFFIAEFLVPYCTTVVMIKALDQIVEDIENNLKTLVDLTSLDSPKDLTIEEISSSLKEIVNNKFTFCTDKCSDKACNYYLTKFSSDSMDKCDSVDKKFLFLEVTQSSINGEAGFQLKLKAAYNLLLKKRLRKKLKKMLKSRKMHENLSKEEKIKEFQKIRKSVFGDKKLEHFEASYFMLGNSLNKQGEIIKKLYGPIIDKLHEQMKDDDPFDYFLKLLA